MRGWSVLSLCAALALAGVLVASTSASAKDSGDQPGGTVPSTSPSGSPSPPFGLIAVQQWLYNKPDQPSAFNSATYGNPSISGVLFRANWSSVEPSEGDFHWQIIDDMFTQAAASGKFVSLSFVPGFATPAWALPPGVITATFDWQYGPPGEGGTSGTLPMPWDATYQGEWVAFLQAGASRYGSNPQFRMISVAGPTSVSEETSLPNNALDPAVPGGDITQWITLGYTPDKYEGAWKTALQEYADIFPA